MHFPSKSESGYSGYALARLRVKSYGENAAKAMLDRYCKIVARLHQNCRAMITCMQRESARKIQRQNQKSRILGQSNTSSRKTEFEGLTITDQSFRLASQDLVKHESEKDASPSQRYERSRLVTEGNSRRANFDIEEIVCEVATYLVPVITEVIWYHIQQSWQRKVRTSRTTGRSFYGRTRSPLQFGKREFDEAKHPRAPAGRRDGGQFVHAHGGINPTAGETTNIDDGNWSLEWRYDLDQLRQSRNFLGYSVARDGTLIDPEIRMPVQSAGVGDKAEVADSMAHQQVGEAKNGSLLVNATKIFRRLDGVQPKKPRESSTFEMDVAIGVLRGLWQSFYVDGIGGYPQLGYDISKSKWSSWQKAYSFLTETLPAASRQMRETALRYWIDPNEALLDADATFTRAHELALKAGGQVAFMYRLAGEIHMLTPRKLGKLMQSPEELEGHVSDEFLLLAIITQETQAELSDLVQEANNLDAETKAYVASYLFGMVLYEVAELYATRSTSLYTKSPEFGRLLKKLDTFPLFKDNSRALATVDRLRRKVFRLFGTEACFVAGTKVYTPAGLVNIEDLNAGDLVLCRDEHDIDLSGPVVPMRVVRQIVTRPKMLCHILVRSDSGQTETLATTASHPFFVADRAEFVAAAGLQVGHSLVLQAGGTAQVVEIHVQHATTGNAFTTYNLEIADAHTYFVGTAGIWVHNTGRLTCELMDAIYERFRKLGYTDELAQAKVWNLFNGRVKSGRYTAADFETDWEHAKRYFRPDGIFESELSYGTRILGKTPVKKVLPVPGGANPEIGPRNPPVRPLGSREYDNFEDKTRTGFEFNQSPWSTMPLDNLRNTVERKVEQLDKDAVLVNTRKVKRVRWIMTEKLPTTGKRGKIVAPLREALEAARERWPDKFTIEVQR